MANTIARPADLPDFTNPPLNEVVLGVQFSPPAAYQKILAGEVWNLFRDKYPMVQEHAPLLPSFEIFGLPQKQSPFEQLTFLQSPLHDRFWFLRPQGDELIQFQQDRLLHNWRQIGDQSNEYPRFEAMITQFHEELSKLQQYVNGLSPQTLVINQCEISYINHIYSETSDALKTSEWLRIFSFENREPDDLTTTFREILRENDNSPFGRLICETGHGVTDSGRPTLALTLTVRGTPKGVDIESALEFIARGRDLIVRRFCELTTETAHQKWGRVK